MAPESANPGDQGNPQAGAQPSTTGDGMIPKARFDEVNERMKAAERRLAEAAQAEEARQRADMEAKGQYDKLRDGYESRIKELEPLANEWTTYQTSRREALLAGLGDDDKPLADGLPLDKLEKLVERLGKKEPPPPGNPPARPGAAPVLTGQATPDEVTLNITKPGWYAANKHRI